MKNKNVQILLDALTSIAFLDERKANNTSYWLEQEDEVFSFHNLCETLANDTQIARDALKDYIKKEKLDEKSRRNTKRA